MRERVKEYKRRLHWSRIERKEVDELRAILASEILAVDTITFCAGTVCCCIYQALGDMRPLY